MFVEDHCNVTFSRTFTYVQSATGGVLSCVAAWWVKSAEKGNKLLVAGYSVQGEQMS